MSSVDLLLGNPAWLDREAAVRRALDFYVENTTEVLELHAAQWEALRRVGEDARNFDKYAGEMREWLIDPERQKHRWGPELTDRFLTELSAAKDPGRSGRDEAFEAEVRRLAESDQTAARTWLEVARAREFVNALVMKIRAEKAKKGARA